MTVKHFAELFQLEAEKGSVIGVIPADMNKATSTVGSPVIYLFFFFEKEREGRNVGRNVLGGKMKTLPSLVLAIAIIDTRQKSLSISQ